MKESVRINFEFPKDQYPYLKLVCAKMGISMRQFATSQLLKAIEEFEDAELARRASLRLEEAKNEELIEWDEACRLAGWDNDNENDVSN